MASIRIPTTMRLERVTTLPNERTTETASCERGWVIITNRGEDLDPVVLFARTESLRDATIALMTRLFDGYDGRVRVFEGARVLVHLTDGRVRETMQCGPVEREVSLCSS